MLPKILSFFLTTLDGVKGVLLSAQSDGTSRSADEVTVRAGSCTSRELGAIGSRDVPMRQEPSPAAPHKPQRVGKEERKIYNKDN